MGVAYELSKQSMARIEAKDRQGWLDLFAEDGVVEDPIGPSMFDPEGAGHRGKEAIAAFYDNVIAMSDSIRFHMRDTYDCGVEVANVGEIHITIGGKVGICHVVSTYRASPDGRLAALRAYWEQDKLAFE
ncbi:MAG TPA: nuclear transport factor 2 family protein [Acidimicrobiales bacterium]|nr:nuclear transport factor 2 family protein [Acidimicrobiales bacterium]